jgi:cysteine sulfinate desulfinase/cysteine desulfurase-like protein/glyoxylase-like metal-dependent hydrolase (beta-lactamase superfamily II)/rhodanese-related sulfurtransferase
MDRVRRTAREVVGAPSGQLLFTSGATEAIQTAVLSALDSLRARRDRGGDAMPRSLLYGATEHKAVPEALAHWNTLLRLDMEILAIPVGRDGRHDLDWLRAQLPRAGLVCTMAVNNETGVVTDLDAVAALMAACRARRGDSPLWLVDGVQALGKMALELVERHIDYAAFSGHKLYAPKGIGLLYAREGAPFTPMMAGGGQEDTRRSGTENMTGIVALGAVLEALDDGVTFRDPATLTAYRDRLATALMQAFPGLVFNAPPEHCLPTTLNFSVPGLSSRLLLDLFDAADVRVSGGSACNAARARPSHVLDAMGVPTWQAESAVRLSFGPASTGDFIDEACARIHACGESLRESCLNPEDNDRPMPDDGVTRLVVDGACCYLLVDAESRRCVVIDPLSALTERLVRTIRCQRYRVVAILDTHGHGDHASSAADLRDAVAACTTGTVATDGLGWPLGAEWIELGAMHLTRLATPGHTEDSTTYLLHDAAGLRLAFVGDTVMPGALGRSDFAQSAPRRFAASLRTLATELGPTTLLLSAHDYEDGFASTMAVEREAQPLLADVLNGRLDDAGFVSAKAMLEQDLGLTEYRTMACGMRAGPCAGADVDMDPISLMPASLQALLQSRSDLLVVDVREAYEQRVGRIPRWGPAVRRQAVPLSALVNALPGWLALPAETPVLFVCRSGNRSAQAAKALRRLGRARSWSLAGGLALWP